MLTTFITVSSVYPATQNSVLVVTFIFGTVELKHQNSNLLSFWDQLCLFLTLITVHLRPSLQPGLAFGLATVCVALELAKWRFLLSLSRHSLRLFCYSAHGRWL